MIKNYIKMKSAEIRLKLALYTAIEKLILKYGSDADLQEKIINTVSDFAQKQSVE